MAESPVPRWRDWRPLEPDADNAAEGSEVSHAFFCAWLFFCHR